MYANGQKTETAWAFTSFLIYLQSTKKEQL